MGQRVALAVHPGSGQGSAARIAGTVAERLRAEVDELTLIAADTDAEKGEYRADYALLPYIGYVAASKAGRGLNLIYLFNRKDTIVS